MLGNLRSKLNGFFFEIHGLSNVRRGGRNVLKKGRCPMSGRKQRKLAKYGSRSPENTKETTWAEMKVREKGV
jgi:hypothetical protein